MMKIIFIPQILYQYDFYGTEELLFAKRFDLDLGMIKYGQILAPYVWDKKGTLLWTCPRAGVLKLFLKRAGRDSSATWKGQNCFWRGGGGVRICAQSVHHEVPCVRGPGLAQGPWKLWGYWCSLMQPQPYFGPFTICLKPFSLLLQQYFMHYILYNCNNFVIYKIIKIIVIILDPCVLKRTWNWGDNAVKDNEWSRIRQTRLKTHWILFESQFNLTAIYFNYSCMET